MNSDEICLELELGIETEEIMVKLLTEIQIKSENSDLSIVR